MRALLYTLLKIQRSRLHCLDVRLDDIKGKLKVETAMWKLVDEMDNCLNVCILELIWAELESLSVFETLQLLIRDGVVDRSKSQYVLRERGVVERE